MATRKNRFEVTLPDGSIVREPTFEDAVARAFSAVKASLIPIVWALIVEAHADGCRTRLAYVARDGEGRIARHGYRDPIF
jgi:hypothetical protein